MPEKTRVLIVDDDALVRAALRMMLSGSDEVEVAGEADDGSQVLAAVRETRPDVVLMDIRMPRVDGLTATEQLMRQPSPPQVIVLTTFDADEYVLRALRAGAGGFLLKDTPPADLVRGIRTVAAGDAMLSPAITRRLIEHVGAPVPQTPSRREEARARLEPLSPRERDVAVAVGRGGSNAEIGEELYMSVATVKAHVSRVMTKLGVTNRVQIAILAHDAELG
ncbi:response regulator transcription factor [Kineosporia mesophila]|uniref:Response regulator transcription factor n=1 Tax=Kineosporia mesophila TaxID=566012 RepID=A0ABP7AFN4_9ACTN|nr:response regulator transcription factor [Kineosporia mesophila]MCD5350935.1 response regulator transcription factor [Kineosporia mesophila]